MSEIISKASVVIISSRYYREYSINARFITNYCGYIKHIKLLDDQINIKNLWDFVECFIIYTMYGNISYSK